jgi:urea carboxylase-associated protein 2
MSKPEAAALSPEGAEHKQQRIAALKARYEALRAEGQSLGAFAARIALAPRLARAMPDRLVRFRASIPPGWYWSGRVPAGTCLRLDNTHGTPGLACLFWNAADPSERYCATDTIKVQWTAALGLGRLLLSDMGRVLASIVEDTCGHHDVLLGAGTPRLEESSSPLVARSGHENLLLATAKLGLEVRDLHAPVTFFAPVRCLSNERFVWEAGVPLGGTYLDLHAEMDLLAAVSSAPHPLAPQECAPQEVLVTIWTPEQTDIAHFCRQATKEADRAFARTQSYVAELKR